MKNLFALMITATMALSLTACTSGNAVDPSSVEVESETIFDKHLYNDYKILVDKETGVCYLEYKGKYITVMLNADGTPKIWEED